MSAPGIRAHGMSIAALLILLLSACTQVPVKDATVRDADVWLLGEVHDNAEGHRQRLVLLTTRIDEGWRPAIAMEQFDRERQAELDEAMRRCADPECVVQAAGNGGWTWSFYLPVIELAQRYQLPLLAANLSRNDAVRVMREGFPAAFDAATVAQWQLDGALPEDLVTAQRQEIIEGHCHTLPVDRIDGMVRAQVARDVSMAQVISPHAQRGVVLLAGNGHVRRDIGVPRWTQLPIGSMVSVGFLEDSHNSPHNSLHKSAASAAASAYDVVRIIPSHDRGDPCAEL